MSRNRKTGYFGVFRSGCGRNALLRDVVLQYRLDEQFHHFTFEQGLTFRHRIVGVSNTSTLNSKNLDVQVTG